MRKCPPFHRSVYLKWHEINNETHAFADSVTIFSHNQKTILKNSSYLSFENKTVTIQHFWSHPVRVSHNSVPLLTVKAPQHPLLGWRFLWRRFNFLLHDESRQAEISNHYGVVLVKEDPTCSLHQVSQTGLFIANLIMRFNFRIKYLRPFFFFTIAFFLFKNILTSCKLFLFFYYL